MNTRQGKRKAYVKLETAVIIISENESLLAGSDTNIGVSPKTQLQAYPLKRIIS